MTASLIVLFTLIVRRSYASNQTTAEGRKEGWVSQPDGRGTFDILWYCTCTPETPTITN